MQIVTPLKEAVVLVKGSFSGRIDKVFSTQVYKYGYLLYDIKGQATVTVYLGWDNVNWIQAYFRTINNSSGWQVIELVGLSVRIVIDANLQEGSFITFVRSSI
ncbi:TPA: hypothetical protein [Aquificae Conch Spring virus]|nr:TPA: hypothetical protein [Aquificae Conch Spring virus]